MPDFRFSAFCQEIPPREFDTKTPPPQARRPSTQSVQPAQARHAITEPRRRRRACIGERAHRRRRRVARHAHERRRAKGGTVAARAAVRRTPRTVARQPVFCVSRSTLRKKSTHGVLHNKHYLRANGRWWCVAPSPNPVPIHPIVLTPTAICVLCTDVRYRAAQASSSSGSRRSTSSSTGTRRSRSEAHAARSPTARSSTSRCWAQVEWYSGARPS